MNEKTTQRLDSDKVRQFLDDSAKGAIITTGVVALHTMEVEQPTRSESNQISAVFRERKDLIKLVGSDKVSAMDLLGVPQYKRDTFGAVYRKA